jgi:hypothetical protein
MTTGPQATASVGAVRADSPTLALSLLVAGVAADDVDPALTADHLAVFANPLDAGTNFHDWTLLRIAHAVGTKRVSIEHHEVPEKA